MAIGRQLRLRRSYRLAQAPERRGAVALGRGAVDADIAEHSVVQDREQSPVAAALTPGDDLFDQSDQRASENGAKPGGAAGALRAQRFGRVKELGAFRRFLGSAHTR